MAKPRSRGQRKSKSQREAEKRKQSKAAARAGELDEFQGELVASSNVNPLITVTCIALVGWTLIRFYDELDSLIVPFLVAGGVCLYGAFSKFRATALLGIRKGEAPLAYEARSRPILRRRSRVNAFMLVACWLPPIVATELPVQLATWVAGGPPAFLAEARAPFMAITSWLFAGVLGALTHFVLNALGSGLFQVFLQAKRESQGD